MVRVELVWSPAAGDVQHRLANEIDVRLRVDAAWNRQPHQVHVHLVKAVMSGDVSGQHAGVGRVAFTAD